MNKYLYKGQVITASCKKEAIHKIVADMAKYKIENTCDFEYNGQKGRAEVTVYHNNWDKDVITNGTIEVKLGSKKATLRYYCDSRGDADGYNDFEGDNTCKDICKTILSMIDRRAKLDRFKGNIIEDVKDAFEYRNWKRSGKKEVSF